MAKSNPASSDGVIASFKSLFYEVTVKDKLLVLSKRFPPATKYISYGEIASVEHKRLMDYGLLIGLGIAVALAYGFSSVKAVEDIIGALMNEVSIATGSAYSGAHGVSMGIAYVCIIVAGIQAIRFGMSMQQRMVIYRTGKNPIAVPMKLTGDSLNVLAKINAMVKEASGLSKGEVEKLIGEEIRSLMDERSKMQDELMSSVKVEFQVAKTVEEKARVKRKLQDGLDKLKAQDDLIDLQLRKTGLTKDDVFKKYRIKAPDEKFISSVLAGEGVDKLMTE